MDTLLKRCCHCKVFLPISDFQKNSTTRDGFQFRCRNCQNAATRAYYATHKEETHQRVKTYRAKNPDKVYEWGRQYRESHREWYRTYQRLWRRKWRSDPKNAELDRERSRKFRPGYYKTHVAQYSHYSRMRRAQKLSAGGSYSVSDIRKMYANQKGKCYWCSKKLNGQYHIDHVIPLSRGGSNDISNIVISCPPCNFEKNDRLPSEWIGRMF
jgi:5-methylcytosine-specific restriction endonuclease McrA